MSWVLVGIISIVFIFPFGLYAVHSVAETMRFAATSGFTQSTLSLANFHEKAVFINLLTQQLWLWNGIIILSYSTNDRVCTYAMYFLIVPLSTTASEFVLGKIKNKRLHSENGVFRDVEIGLWSARSSTES